MNDSVKKALDSMRRSVGKGEDTRYVDSATLSEGVTVIVTEDWSHIPELGIKPTRTIRAGIHVEGQDDLSTSVIVSNTTHESAECGYCGHAAHGKEQCQAIDRWGPGNAHSDQTHDPCGCTGGD